MIPRGAAVLRCVSPGNPTALAERGSYEEMAVEEDRIEVEGEVVEALPSTTFRAKPRDHAEPVMR